MFNMNWKDLQPGEIVAGASVAAVVVLVIGMLSNWLVGATCGLASWYSVVVLHRRCVSDLTDRAASADGVMWNIVLNGVKVGTISDEDYAVIRLKVLTDWRNYIAQLLNLGRVAMRILISLFIALPALVFWCAVVVTFFTPDALAYILIELRAATPTQITDATRVAMHVLALLGIMTIGFNAIRGERYGYVDQYGEVTTLLLRRHIGVAANGTLVLERWVRGVNASSVELG